ncbi:MAG TPA: beta-galactosidase [Anaerolineales bacterium]|nr:beta-galactosidase [Anaerolineales bacterium]
MPISEASRSSRLHLGAAYYPEHWPEDHWSNDIRLMREAGFTVARMAEFAWSTVEPKAGQFDFDWLDRAIAQLAAEGIVSVLGTPTAAPPAWLVQEYPDLLAVNESGRRVLFGNRCHYCVNSPDFHAATRRIVGAMAEHFGPNPNVIGWQIDNEYHRVCYCERCQVLFQSYLARKFGSLEALNEHWTTRYWSQTYSAWEQIPLPNPSYLTPTGLHNPGLMLEFKHFITESYRQFQRLQIDLLRPHLGPETWITHNFMGWFDGYDHYEISADLDLAAWDWYVSTGQHDYLNSGAIHDLTRGFKRRTFWLMETQPGNVNWAAINTTTNQGEARVMAWHAVAHGADAVLYWQWRSALGGQEQMHGTLVGPSGQPRPFYEEVQLLGREFAAVSSLLADSVPAAHVAMLHSYDDRWSIHIQRHHRDFDYVNHFNHYYRPLAASNIAVDVLSPDASLDGYQLVIAPTLLMLNETRAARLKLFVENGGHLVLTIRCGMKDDYNALLPTRQPGALTEIAGVEVEEYYALLDPVPVSGSWFRGTSSVWAERLKVVDPSGLDVIARYDKSNGWLDQQVAITSHRYGSGMVTFVGAYLDDASQKILLDRIVQAAGVLPVLETPPGVEARTRIDPNGREIFIVINHERVEHLVKLPWAAQDHLRGQTLKGRLKLEPYGVAILTQVSQ